ncbi:MAG: hypothetical protein IKI94_06855 [Ruminococcus sp.]|nr:hypothetical protein [Ruminococcus sp.]
MNNKLEHLKMIQSIITRMNTNSFQIKGWTITLVSALLALYANCDEVKYIYIAIVPVIVFWVLDSFFLQQERKFRALYNDIVNTSRYGEEIKEFSMPIVNYNTCNYCMFKAMISVSCFSLYGNLTIVLLICSVFVR